MTAKPLPKVKLSDLCQALGYDVSRVISVRVNHRQAWVVHENDWGALLTTQHVVVDE